MPFVIPSLDTTRARLVALAKSLFPGLNFGSRRSYHGKKTTFLSGAVTQLHFHVDSAQRDVHVLTAGDGKPINDWGIATGVERKGATGARKSDAGRVRGSAASSAASGNQLVHDASGLIFQLGETATIPGILGDPDGFVDVDIAAVSTGSSTRLKAGETLRFLSSIPGIQPNVVLQLDLDEDGFDDEQYGSYRSRVVDTFSGSRSGGSQGDFVNWAIESLASVAKAYAYGDRAGRGTVDVAAFYNASGSARALTVDDRATVKAYIASKVPLQLSGDSLRVLLTVPDPQRVEIRLQTNGSAAYQFDWIDDDGPTVASWNGTTRELQFSIPLPTSLRAGHRLILDAVSTPGSQDGHEIKIESISAADKVILESAPTNAPQVGDLIYSGGPLVKPVRDAIVAHLNGENVYAGRGLVAITEGQAAPSNPNGPSIVGLDILADGIGAANPAGRYGTWSGSLLVSTIYKIAMYKAGVRNATIVSPAADYDSIDDAFPNDGQIHYVTPGPVIVRRA